MVATQSTAVLSSVSRGLLLVEHPIVLVKDTGQLTPKPTGHVLHPASDPVLSLSSSRTFVGVFRVLHPFLTPFRGTLVATGHVLTLLDVFSIMYHPERRAGVLLTNRMSVCCLHYIRGRTLATLAHVKSIKGSV